MKSSNERGRLNKEEVRLFGIQLDRVEKSLQEKKTEIAEAKVMLNELEDSLIPAYGNLKRQS